MSVAEIIAVLVCLILGYCLVAPFVNLKSNEDLSSSAESGETKQNRGGKQNPNGGTKSQSSGEKYNTDNHGNTGRSGKKESSYSDSTGDRSNGQERGQHYNASNDDGTISWYEVLGVSLHSNLDEITVAYKRKIREYHPDKVALMGEEIRRLAEFKSKQINVAYDYAMKIRRGH